MRGFIVSLALLVAGCGGHSNVRMSSGGPPPGGASAGGSVSINSQPRSAIGTLIVIGAAVGIYHGSESTAGGYGMRYRANPFDAIQPTLPAPQLDASRSVHEQDCSKPIENWSANLKCR